MITKIDHVGIVVRNIDETLKIFSNMFGFRMVESVTDPRQEFRSVLVFAGDAALELIEPISPKGNIAKFLEQRGQSIHHLSLSVDNIEQELESLQAKGIRLVNKEPQSLPSAQVAFIHPHSTGGILIELIQRVQYEP